MRLIKIYDCYAKSINELEKSINLTIEHLYITEVINIEIIEKEGIYQGLIIYRKVVK